MQTASRYLCLALVSLIGSGCTTNSTDFVEGGISYNPYHVPSSLFFDVKNMEQFPLCNKDINVVGDFEDCYNQVLQAIPYVEQDRCYRVKQIKEIVWIASTGTQVVDIPEWCDTL